MPSIALPVSLRGQLLSGSKFSPYSLFTFGTQGIWLDPSDVANLNWRVNLLTYSEQFDNAAWASGYTGSITRTANTIAAPDGTITADTLTATGTGGRAIQQVVSATASATYTFSVWLKRKTGTGQVRIYANYDALANRLITEDITDWVRVSYTYTGSALWPGVFVNTSGDEIYAWGAQLELGTSATDYQRISDVNTEVIERFPTATMYQDAAGTTAVTTPGQPVGLRLDKSKGLARTTIGTLPLNASPWSSLNGATLSASTVTCSAGNQGAKVATIAGRWYRVTADASALSGNFVYLAEGSGTNYGSVVSGSHTRVFNATSTGFVVYATVAGAVSYSSITVEEIAGNHATQSVLASRPVYGIEPAGGRRNLLTFSEDLSNAAWLAVGTNATATKGSISTDKPDGSSGVVSTLTFSAVPSTAGSYAFSYQSLSAAYLNTPVSLSVWLRVASGVGSVYLNLEDTVTPPAAGNFIASPALSLTTAWQRFTLTGTRTGGSGNVAAVIGFDTRVVAGQTNASALTVQVWGAQLELGSTATPYQRVTTAFDVTEAGVQSCHYVQYDGSDDGMITNSIDFTATDKMSVFAGVRKLSDAASGTVLDLNGIAGIGSIMLRAPSGASANYAWYSGGSIQQGAVSANSYAAPITNVLTGLADISGDLATLRANGTQIAQVTADQGTGNFSNLPLYFGRRQGTALPLNGRDYGIVVVGKATTADEITSTERWLSGKTGFYAPVITGVPTIGVS